MKRYLKIASLCVLATMLTACVDKKMTEQEKQLFPTRAELTALGCQRPDDDKGVVYKKFKVPFVETRLEYELKDSDDCMFSIQATASDHAWSAKATEQKISLKIGYHAGFKIAGVKTVEVEDHSFGDDVDYYTLETDDVEIGSLIIAQYGDRVYSTLYIRMGPVLQTAGIEALVRRKLALLQTADLD